MIVGFNVTNIEAFKKDNVKGNLQINYTPNIKKVTKTQVSAFQEQVAKIDFEFVVNYEAKGTVGGKIKLEGNVLWNKSVDELVSHWEDNEELPEQVRIPLLNDLYRKMLSEAVGIANTLNMLPPIPTPKVGKDSN